MHQESCHNPNQDVCETILAVAKPGLHDLKSRFVHKPWWSLTFPYPGRTERDREHALYAAEDVVLGRNVSHISRASSTECPLTVTEEEWEQRKEKALASSRTEVDINGNGTSGYTVKEGVNKNKVLGHRVVKSTDNW